MSTLSLYNYYNLNEDSLQFNNIYESNILDCILRWNEEAKSYEIVYRLKPYLNDSLIISSISILLKDKNAIKKSIFNYKRLIEKIDSFIPYELYDQITELLDILYNDEENDGCDEEMIEIYLDEIKKNLDELYCKLDEKYTTEFTEKIDESLLISFYNHSIIVKSSSIDGINTILDCDYAAAILDDYDKKYFFDVLINAKNVFSELVKELEKLI